jgi:hypothetical protein
MSCFGWVSMPFPLCLLQPVWLVLFTVFSFAKETMMATPITPKQMSEWIAKTWKECQDKAWSCKKTTPTKELDKPT